MDIVIVLVLICFSGLFSGLTLGLLSLTISDLERQIKLGEVRAQKVYSVRKRGNLLLCTLLLGNVAVNAALSIFLGSVASGLVAGIIATGLIFIFGEIVPQAVCARYALAVGARTAWLVKILIFVLFPICYPIAWILDRMLGNEMPVIWSRTEIQEIIREHEDSPLSAIDEDEERIVLGALTYSNKTARDILTPEHKAFMLESQEVLDRELLLKIKERGFTRIPVFKDKKENLLGLLYVKDLLGLEEGATVEEICRKKKLLEVRDKRKLDDLLNMFIREKVHMACIFNEFGGLVGLATVEDLVEEILAVEIVDETDRVENIREEAQRSARKKFGSDSAIQEAIPGDLDAASSDG